MRFADSLDVLLCPKVIFVFCAVCDKPRNWPYRNSFYVPRIPESPIFFGITCYIKTYAIVDFELKRLVLRSLLFTFYIFQSEILLLRKLLQGRTSKW